MPSDIFAFKMKKINIALDGYSGTGKSSTAKEVASQLGYTYLDSGAMYRAVTLYFLEHDVDLKDLNGVIRALDLIDITFQYGDLNKKFETYLNGKNVEKDIREMRISENVSAVSAISEVREKLVAIQRKLGENKGIVMDGRDIGTVVFPEAELKVFLTADMEVRAERRRKELEEKGITASLVEIMGNLKERDRVDSSRQISPLTKATDAIELDTTALNFQDQVAKVVQLARERMEQLI